MMTWRLLALVVTHRALFAHSHPFIEKVAINESPSIVASSKTSEIADALETTTTIHDEGYQWEEHVPPQIQQLMLRESIDSEGEKNNGQKISDKGKHRKAYNNKYRYDDDDDDGEEEYTTRTKKSSRFLFWGPKFLQHQQSVFLQSMGLDNQQKKQQQEQEESARQHPLRTNLWRIQLAKMRNRRLFPQSEMELDFDESGFVLDRLSNRVGTWKLIPLGVQWQFHASPSNGDDDVAAGTKHYFTGELSINQFGKHPKMIRGIIVRDRNRNSFLPKHWLRPVVATFTAQGIGQDLIDFSYKDRGFGINSPKK